MRKKEPPFFDEEEYPGDYEESLLEMFEFAITDWDEKHGTVWEVEAYDYLSRLSIALMSATSDPMESESIIKLLTKYLIQLKSNEDYVEDYDDLEFEYNDVPEFEEFIESELSKESMGMIASGINRLKDLMSILILIQENPVPEIPLNYLKRVFRCYIWGLDPECVILCRSVLDVAVDEKIPDRLCARYCDPNKSYYTLADKVKTIKMAKLLPREITNKLQEVKLRGNKCVHGDMQAVGDIKGTIDDTATVLMAIFTIDTDGV